jgi:D-sedoheptulose 7-phosphate isomerase
MSSARIQSALAETRDVMLAVCSDSGLHNSIGRAADIAVERLKAGNKLLFCGNGGSAADAQHLAGELVSRFLYDRPGLPAFALTVDTSVLTAIGNDYGYERAFSRQVEAVGQHGDVLFAFSTSGRSPNILAALQSARQKGLHTVALTGRTGGVLHDRADVVIHAPSDSTPRIQEVHITVGHLICQIIEERMFPK